jgi:hypothetical protein
MAAMTFQQEFWALLVPRVLDRAATENISGRVSARSKICTGTKFAAIQG